MPRSHILLRHLLPLGVVSLAICLFFGCTAANVTAPGVYHQVLRGETIYRIAMAYGVDPNVVMRVNHISDPTTLQPGQLLYIPGARYQVHVPVPTVSTLSSSPQSAIGRGVAESFRWRYIVIHHSATDEGNAEIFDKHHRNVRGWAHGLGYHFVIDNGTAGTRDGQVEVSRRWINQWDGAHAGNATYNRYGIGICLVGDFEHSRPTPAQMAALADLCAALMERYNIPLSNVIGHKDINPKHTICPGRYFPMSELKWQLRARGLK